MRSVEIFGTFASSKESPLPASAAAAAQSSVLGAHSTVELQNAKELEERIGSTRAWASGALARIQHLYERSERKTVEQQSAPGPPPSVDPLGGELPLSAVGEAFTWRHAVRLAVREREREREAGRETEGEGEAKLCTLRHTVRLRVAEADPGHRLLALPSRRLRFATPVLQPVLGGARLPVRAVEKRRVSAPTKESQFRMTSRTTGEIKRSGSLG